MATPFLTLAPGQERQTHGASRPSTTSNREHYPPGQRDRLDVKGSARVLEPRASGGGGGGVDSGRSGEGPRGSVVSVSTRTRTRRYGWDVIP
jgi:hypothetical protein